MGSRYCLFGDPTVTDTFTGEVVAAPKPKVVIEEHANDEAVTEEVDGGGAQEKRKEISSEVSWEKVLGPGEAEAQAAKAAAAAAAAAEAALLAEAAEGGVDIEVDRQEIDTATPIDGAAPDGDILTDEESKPKSPGLYRWEKSHTVANVDENFVMQLNRDPLVPFFLFRDFSTQKKVAKAKETATDAATPDAGETDDAEATSEKVVTPAAPEQQPGMMSHYQHATVLDLSPLLSGQTCISRTFGAHSTATALAEEYDVESEVALAVAADSTEEEEEEMVEPVGAAPSTARSAAESHASLGRQERETGDLVEKEGSDGAPQQQNAPVTDVNASPQARRWLHGVLNERSKCVFPPPPGLAYLRVRVLVDRGGEPLLSQDHMDRFNPLTITVVSARDLPGVRVEAATLQKYVKESPFALQQTYCRPTYVVVQPMVAELGPRLVATEGQPTGEDASWDYSTTFLTGGNVIDRHLFEEAMEMQPLRVELHDRDPLQGADGSALYDGKPESTFGGSLGRYERLITGEEQLEQLRTDEVVLDEGSLAEEEAQKAASAASAVAAQAEAAVEVEAAEQAMAEAAEASLTAASKKGKKGKGELEALAAAEAAAAEALAAAKVKLAVATEAAGPAMGIPVEEVDKIYMSELAESWRSAGDHFSHGTAKFRLEGLLDQAKPLAKAFATTKMHTTSSNFGDAQHSTALQRPKLLLKMREGLLPTKRRVMPKGGEDDWALKEGERLVRKPGAYMSSDASIRVIAKLHRPYRSLEEDAGEFIGTTTLAPRPFSRAVFIFEYKDVAMLHAVNRAIDDVNTAALGDSIQGSLRSHQLSAEQTAGAEAGSLNVMCGFQIIDDHCRMVVVEGLVQSVATLTDEAVPRGRANDNACRILSNPAIGFHRRLYTAFNVDLKKIKLRDPLPILCEMPEIYNRTKVSPACFEALHRLQAVRNANRIVELAKQSLFPLVDQLLQVESKYGESISMEDIDGRTVTRRRSRVSTREARALEQQQEQAKDKSGTGGALESSGGGAAAAAAMMPPPPPASTTANLMNTRGGGDTTTTTTDGAAHTTARRKAPTDSRNSAFEESRRAYSAPDFLTSQREELERTLAHFEEQKLVRMAERAADPVPSKFVYSGQKLQYTELKKGEMRAKLGREKNTHFTYSKDYLAAAVSMVDETRLKLDAEAEARAAWKTKRGFVYPAPKKVVEFAQHPSKPSNSRIDALKEPWVENEMHPLPVGRQIELAEGQSDFDTIPAQGKELFGGLHVPKYERPYDNNNLGSERRLPRGRMTLEKNSDYYRSVHLTGEGLAEERAQQIKKEQEAWMAKVVVENLDFKMTGFTTRDRPLQTSKLDDILKGPPLSKPLKIVRNARLPSGKRVPLRPPPISAFSAEEYKDPRDFTADLRPGRCS
jgi:hypothetical protein